MFSRILNYKIFNGNMRSLLDYIDRFDKVNIVSGNPQVLNSGLKNEKLFKSFTDSNAVIIPDGIGTVICSKIVGEPVEEKIAGIELMDNVIKQCELDGKSIYLIGAKQEILDNCIVNLREKYPKLDIVGSHNGYFDLKKCDEIVQDIIKKEPYAVFVAMGCPRQELFIADNIDRLNCKILMGVGGSFDVIAGKVNRAPKWMIKMGLEWLYRTVKEPFRIKRLGEIPVFIIKTLIYNKKS
ncbi:putative N-acetylmannosaminyltransferase [Clostridium tepidiprofundi DSM 19306]|uniref:N-acetylglucosaminyldiphosphoundecaprenol N-acetyl-beta-D-mannosaminyltransferase n=1 Tax=Clostridium tepidiprofundi DSM 19306 TaxID=1121338 RepID=A0A151B5G8_9CLOT|nr:WecB/TagA/CpsF family glycosyltransferase [Clostridium tepidiprofundi]KYH35126.1 putative N-acetylmannosaminyltransferase [Clostridium tepidiprofundi DSM 19306]